MSASRIQQQISDWTERFKGNPAWSVCEIGLSDADYNALLDDLKQIEPYCFRKPPEWLGFALTIALAECGRRHAGEDNFWAPVSLQFADMPWHSKIFTHAGQPTSKGRKMLEDTARHFRLRHVYGNEDTMEWYVSIRLQFGFSQKGFERRLHEWLCGAGMPVPVRFLLGLDKDRPELKSESFYRLWKCLYRFRKDNLPERQLRQCLNEVPWVLPEWHEGLVRKALEQREYDYVYRPHGINEDFERDFPEEVPPEDQLGFLTAPQLQWIQGQAPQFKMTFEADNLDWSGYTEPEATLVIGGQRKSRALRQTDGVYLPETWNIVLANPPPEIDAEIQSPDGLLLAEQHVVFWDTTADVVMFDLTAGGVALPTNARYQLKDGNEYVALVSPDLALSPNPTEIHRFAGRGMLRFTARAGTSVAVVFPDKTELARLDCSESVPFEGCQQIGVELTEGGGVKVTFPQRFRLRCVRKDGSTLSGVTLNETTWKSDVLDLTDADHARGIRLQIVIVLPDGIPHTVSRTITTPVGDGPSVWEACDGQTFTPSAFTQRNLHPDKGRSGRFVFKVNGEAASHFIFEGDYCHGRVKDKPMNLRGLHGYGAPLVIGFSRFQTSELRTVSPTVIDTGILDALDGDTLALRFPLYRREGYSLLVVKPDGAVAETGFETGTPASRLELRESIHSDGWAAFGLFFNGELKGSLWNVQTFSRFLDSTADALAIARIAALFKLPFLHGDCRKRMRGCVLECPAEFLEVWTSPEGRGVQFGDAVLKFPNLTDDDAARFSVCSLIGTERLSLATETCGKLIERFGGKAGTTTSEEFAVLIDDVLDWSPRLAAELARCTTDIDKDTLCVSLLKREQREKCIQSVARGTGTNDSFIRRLLTVNGCNTDPQWHQNVRRLLHNRMFRRLLTCFFISNPRI